MWYLKKYEWVLELINVEDKIFIVLMFIIYNKYILFLVKFYLEF